MRSAALSRDVLASIVVFLVALPLCMGIAIASGFPPFAGLVTGVVGGILVGSISGSPFQVSGPAAGLAVIVLEMATRFGLATTAAITLLAGVFQMAAAGLRLGQWFRAVSPSVIYGMLAGIGVLILSSQFYVMVDSKPVGAGWQNIAQLPSQIFEAFRGDQGFWAGVVGLATIAGILAWNRYRPNRLKAVPGALVGVTLGSVLAATLGGPSSGIAFVSVPSDLLGALQWVTPMTLLESLARPEIWAAAAGVAFIASAETLLCATAVDQMHSGEKTRYDQELFAQGVGNSICGALGAIPMTGVIVRSSANVNAGAVSRKSTILHGVWILLFVALLPQVLRQIPMSALAAILVHTGFKLLDLKAVKELARHSRWEVAVYGVTLTTIVATDLLGGVLVGLGFALIRLVVTLARLEIVIREDSISLSGVATFVNLPKLAKALESAPKDRSLELDTSQLRYVDPACLSLINEFRQRKRAETQAA